MDYRSVNRARHLSETGTVDMVSCLDRIRGHNRGCGGRERGKEARHTYRVQLATVRYLTNNPYGSCFGNLFFQTTPVATATAIIVEVLAVPADSAATGEADGSALFV